MQGFQRCSETANKAILYQTFRIAPLGGHGHDTVGITLAAQQPFRMMSYAPTQDLLPKICSAAEGAIPHHTTSIGKPHTGLLANQKRACPQAT